ncbi:MAG: hypothetical protein LLF94_00065 [Chlamydiales bacterium]|nr:hypothetical protein [Chlamydiales bacterium]
MYKMLAAFMIACTRVTCLFGAEVTVTTALQLTEAINDFAENATETSKIIVSGTIQGNFSVPQTNHPIILKGKKGSNAALDGQQDGTVLLVNLGATVYVKHLTIKNGQNDSIKNGGGITNFGHMHLKDCIVTNCTSDTTNQYATFFGGGIYNANKMDIRQCVVTLNSADRGGGIYNLNEMHISDSDIRDNALSPVPRYGYGAGIFNEGYMTVSKSNIHGNASPNGFAGGVYTEGKMYIKDSNIFNNSALNNCGGIENDVYLNMDTCKIYNNTAGADGGGVYNDYGDMVIKNCSIYDNTSQEGDGGGIANVWNLKISNSTVRNNQALNGNGGGISNSWLLLADKTEILGNSALQGYGGGVINFGNRFYDLMFATISHSTIEKNHALVGGGIANEDGAKLELLHSKVYKNTATAGNGGIDSPPPSELYEHKSKVYENLSIP